MGSLGPGLEESEWDHPCKPVSSVVVKFLSDGSRGTGWNRKNKNPSQAMSKASMPFSWHSGKENQEPLQRIKLVWASATCSPTKSPAGFPLPPQHLLEPWNIIKLQLLPWRHLIHWISQTGESQINPSLCCPDFCWALIYCGDSH